VTGAAAVAVAATFVWLGMVLAISFLEAPLKFRAPGVTLRIGLGIGRLVFRALNAAEAMLAVTVLASLAAGSPRVRVVVPLAVAAAVLAVQLVFVRPRLTRRSDAVLAGQDVPRSHAHHVYIALEAVKTIALLGGGILLLAS
jgi:cell division protein FtsW (lipid II flippase)